MMNEEIGDRIVCAAIEIKFDGYASVYLCGVRHWDDFMHDQFRKLQQVRNFSPEEEYRVTQGFLDNREQFLTRSEAWAVAEAAGQIIRRCGGDSRDGGTLYSENLY